MAANANSRVPDTKNRGNSRFCQEQSGNSCYHGAMDPRAALILNYWLATTPAKLWFEKNEATDKHIRTTFEGTLREVARKPRALEASPRERVAKVILMDQFPRNMFRGSAEAFAFDPLARAQTLAMLTHGEDQGLTLFERMFVYLPLEHAEDTALQERSVTCFTSLQQLAPESTADYFREALVYAKRHRDIIARFGRFPHRNTTLGRPSSAAELEFLKEPMSSF